MHAKVLLLILFLFMLPEIAAATDYMPSWPISVDIEDDCISINYFEYSPMNLPLVVLVCSGSFLGRSPGDVFVLDSTDDTHITLEESVEDFNGKEIDSRTSNHEVLAALYWEDQSLPDILDRMNLRKLGERIWIDPDRPFMTKEGEVRIPLSSLDSRVRRELANDSAFIAVSTWHLGLRLFRLPGGKLSQIGWRAEE